MEPEGSPSLKMIDEIHSNGGINLCDGDVDDEPSIDDTTTTTTNNRPIISSGEQLDVEAYGGLYQGRTKIMRLLFIAENCESNPAMRLEALRMAHDEIKKGENTQLYREVVQKIDGELGPNYAMDSAWCDSVDRRADQKKEKLENELNAYRVFLLFGFYFSVLLFFSLCNFIVHICVYVFMCVLVILVKGVLFVIECCLVLFNSNKYRLCFN